MESDASFLVQKLGGWIALVDALKTAVWVHLEVIPTADEVPCNLGTF